LNNKITRDYMSGTQKFTAKVAIVQTWDRVGFYDRRTNKENTFQIIIVSDGFDNTFAGMYYDKIEWTTGDDSGGINGLGGTQAQMGFDDGKKTNHYAHDWSRTADVIKLANKEFIFAISDVKICGAGEELVKDKCIPRSCAVQNPFPILDINGQKQFLDNDNKNDKYVQPPVLVGGCAVHLKDLSKKVNHGTKCYLKCEYDADKGRTSQPKDMGDLETTNEGVAAECKATKWVETAAQSCVEVGIEATVSNADAAGKFKVRESVDASAETIQVSLKSKPYTTGPVVVELQTSCKNGKALHSRAQGNDKKFFCKDDPNDANKETKPLAEFIVNGRGHYVTTLLFTASNWNVPQKLSIKGIDNQEKSVQGFEKFKVFLGIHSADGENCNSVGCSTQTPYTLLKQISINGELTDNEVLEIKPIKDSTSLISDESGAEAMFFLRPVVDNNKQYVGKKLSCTSSDPKEGTLVAYSEGDVKASKLGERKPLKDGEVITLTEQDVTFYVAGQPDDVVDGPQKYQMKCALTDPKLGAILPLDLTNKDKNTPGIIVTTLMSAVDGDCTDKVVDGCGRLQTTQAGPGTDAKVAYVEVKLATRPRSDVLVQVEAARKANKGDNDKVEITPSFETFTPSDWMKPRRFKVAPANADILGALFGGARVLQEQLFITVDSSGTKDTGLSIFHVADKTYEHVLGYASCGADPLSSGDATTAAPATDSKALEDGELERMRRQIPENCFSYDSSKITGLKEGDKVPDEHTLQFGVDVDHGAIKDTTEITLAAGIGIVSAVTITLICLAIAGALVAKAIRRKRGEEADRKADVKKGADKAENDISFRMDEMENGGMRDLEGTTCRLKGERDRLKEENQKLAADVGQEPMLCADTEDSDALVEQIKGLKGENDRLREMQQSNRSKRNRRKKKKADGFGQQQE